MDCFLPFEPESLESMKARYVLAVEPVFDVEYMEFGLVIQPWFIRTHVFDAEDFLRITVFREEQAGFGVALRIMGTLDPRFSMEEAHNRVEYVCKKMETLFREISGDHRKFTAKKVLPTGFMHWMILEKEPHQIDIGPFNLEV